MASAADTDYYRILGVARDATIDEIKRAYRGLSKFTHSDASDVPAGLFDVITEARDVLIDPDRRADYDRALSRGTQARPGVPTRPPPPAAPPRRPAGPTRPPPPGYEPGPDAGAVFEPVVGAAPGAADGADRAAEREREVGVFGQLKGLRWQRALEWVALLGVLAGVLSALRVALVPVPAGLPFAPTVTLGPWGGMGGRVAVSVVGAALVAPWAAVRWEIESQRLWLSGALAVAVVVLVFAEFVCAVAVMCVVVAAVVWVLRWAWRAFLWTYGAP